MTAILLREVFADPKVSAQASVETRTVTEASNRVTKEYIQLANESLEQAKEAVRHPNKGGGDRAAK